MASWDLGPSARAARALAGFVIFFASWAGVLSGCQAGRQVRQGEAAAADPCTSRPQEENNCLACSAEPACGWCGSPDSGQPHCQPTSGPGVSATCGGIWAVSTEQCPPPPPPPPLASPEDAR